jgi:hypothetical protein
MLNNEMTEKEFVAQVLSLYLRLSHTPACASRTDRQLAVSWYAQGLAWKTLEGALLLAAARRSLRDPALPSLPPIRSLHYSYRCWKKSRLRPSRWSTCNTCAANSPRSEVERWSDTPGPS